MNLLRSATVSAPPAGAVSTTPAAAGATMPQLHSALYSGWVRHRRYAPKALAFRYPLFLMYLDLAELAATWSNSVAAITWATRRKRWTKRCATACSSTAANARSVRCAC